MHLTTELIHALPVSERRVFSRDEAASYLGVSPGLFDSLVIKRIVPRSLPLPSRVKRWDKVALDRALNDLSGLHDNNLDGSATSAYDTWRADRGQG